jgi:predicted DNA-binding antitoxin AbrB/MazE fold protein
MVSIRAIYENGTLHLLKPVDLKEGQEVEITIVPKDTQSKRGERILGLHPGAMQMSDDFDEPLPDSFWLGEDE